MLFGRSDALKSVRRYILSKQCVFVAAYTICNKYGNKCMDIWILYRGYINLMATDFFFSNFSISCI